MHYRNSKLKNIVSSTAFKTIIIVIMALIVAFTAASLAIPQHMASMFENMGAYSFATGYASLAYKYKDTAGNLARCVDDSILAEDDDNVINFGDKLVSHADFAAYAKTRTEESGLDYYHFVYSYVACAKYTRGEKDNAFQTATESMQNVLDFPENNAFAALAIKAAENSDKEFAEKIYLKILELDLQPTEEQTSYYGTVLTILTQIQ